MFSKDVLSSDFCKGGASHHKERIQEKEGERET